MDINSFPSTVGIINAFRSKKGSTWSKMNQADKGTFVRLALTEAWVNANASNSPKDLFIEILKIVGEMNFYGWMSKNNDWIPNRIKQKEDEFKLGFEERKRDNPDKNQSASNPFNISRPGSSQLSQAQKLKEYEERIKFLESQEKQDSTVPVSQPDPMTSTMDFLKQNKIYVGLIFGVILIIVIIVQVLKK